MRCELATLRAAAREKASSHAEEIAASKVFLASERALREKAEWDTNLYKERLSSVLEVLKKMGLGINIS